MLNKKVLAAAVVGALLIGGNAVAAPLTVTKQYYAKEIVFPTTGLVPSAAPALSWASGYNFSAGEVKYVRVELTGATFASTLTTAPTVTNGTVGAINGLGTNVITFSVTSTPGLITAASVFALPLANQINIPTQGDVSVKVSMYDQASQAQAGGTTGLLQIGSYDNTMFLTFVNSYALNNVANTLVADVAADPLYSDFIADATTVPATTALAGTLNNNLSVYLVDPDGTAGPQGATLQANGSEMTLATLFAAGTKMEVEGDFTASTGVTLGGAASTPIAPYTATTTKLAWSGVPTAGAKPLVFNASGTASIPAGDYKATFTPVAMAGYAVTPLTATVAGSIRRNGLELQAPLAQLPAGWLSRLVLTNTGTASPKYTIKLLSEAGNTITTANTTGVVAPGTTVIDLKNVMTAFSNADKPRGTVVVNVEAKDAVGAGTIQGLYQIVNPDKGSISNHVMVRPGTN